MSKATTGMMSTKWQNGAARRRCHTKFRRHLARILSVPVDCVMTTGEMQAEARTLQTQTKAAA